MQPKKHQESLKSEINVVPMSQHCEMARVVECCHKECHCANPDCLIYHALLIREYCCLRLGKRDRCWYASVTSRLAH